MVAVLTAPVRTSSQPERGGCAGLSNGAEDRSCKVTPRRGSAVQHALAEAAGPGQTPSPWLRPPDSESGGQWLRLCRVCELTTVNERDVSLSPSYTHVHTQARVATTVRRTFQASVTPRQVGRPRSSVPWSTRMVAQGSLEVPSGPR